MVWATVHVAWGLCKPTNIANLFSGWLNGIPKPYKPLILVGAAALCWSVWLCRNAVVFEKQTIFLFAGTLHDYALATYLGYPTTAYFHGDACCGFSFIGASGQGCFYPGTWVAI